jgi:hypothetical protein
MGNAQLMLEVALLLLLAATLFHALRLERALGVLKRDRTVLEELVEGFNDSTRQAEEGIERLRGAAEGAGRQIARQIESAQKLRDDLSFLADRSDRLAGRLESAVRSARMFADSAPLPAIPPLPAAGAQPRQALAEDVRAPLVFPTSAAPLAVTDGLATSALAESPPRLRSQAERDLLRALRAGR